MPRKGGHPETPKAGPKLANKYSGLVIIVAENGFMLKKADKRLIESMNGSGTQTWVANSPDEMGKLVAKALENLES